MQKFQEQRLFSVPLVEWAFREPIKTAQELAQELAGVSREMEQIISGYKEATLNEYLKNLFNSFKRELLPNLKVSSDNAKDYSFADIYAQTIAYGLFTARVFSHVQNPREDFNRQDAWAKLPETNPFLRQLFQGVSEQPVEDLGDDLAGKISEVFSILRAAKMDAILSDFRQKMNREDIVIRFYEDFLSAYKPEMRERRGVYYTPEPVVSYMVRSVDILLKEKFDKPLGLADPEVMILDPACGTGTFLLWIFQLIHQRFEENPEAIRQRLEEFKGRAFPNLTWSEYVQEGMLDRIFGFELLMAPYAICHLKLGLFLEEMGYTFNRNKRLGVYLINSLEDINLKEEEQQLALDIPEMERLIAEESASGYRVKKSEPVRVVIGNPPYSVNSVNKSGWVTDLVRNAYYPNDDMKERNPKMLLDDYVKFIRFGQWRIDQTQQGILAFITNHGYLDNPTFRGMRWSLGRSFNQVKVMDLHGNTKKKEVSLDGSRDENVFDIQQGVAVGLLVKDQEAQADSSSLRKAFHAHLYGNRTSKYDWLQTHDVLSTDWHELKPQAPFYLLIPQNTNLLGEYEQGWKITDVMPVNSTGVKTHRDHFVIDFDDEKLKHRITEFRDLEISDNDIATRYKLLDTRDWKLGLRRRSLAANQTWEQYLTQCLYRPFDVREYYHHQDVVELPRNEVMRHIVNHENLGMVFMRQVAIQEGYNHFIVTNLAVDNRAFYSNKGTMQISPLCLYPVGEATRLEYHTEISHLSQDRRVNFSPKFFKDLTAKLDTTPTPEAIFYYIYAVFHSPTYRSRYAEFLKIDFPRVPLTRDIHLFQQLAAYGEELVALHLMKSPVLENLITQFEDENRTIDPGHPKYANGKVTINKRGAGFTGVPEEVWNFYIGGYQVCHKWLKDRKGRTLSDDDILHYQKIIVALQETIRIMQQIDDAIPSWPIE
jgi:predicted helicase